MKMRQSHIPDFATTEFALAVTISLYFPIESITKENPRRASFSFKNTSQLQQLVSQYWRGEVQVEPRQFFDQLKAVKSRLYSHP